MQWVIVIIEFKVPGKGDLLFEVAQLTELLSWPNCRDVHMTVNTEKDLILSCC